MYPHEKNQLPTGWGNARLNVKREDCYFYTFVNAAGELIPGDWDTRACVDDYLGQIDYAGKTVLEIGPASGFLTFTIEAKGGSVTCIELADDYIGDLVPHTTFDMAQAAVERRVLMDKIINSFWYSHQAKNSSARVYYGDAKQLPSEIGTFDIGLLGAVLLHSRDPLGILHSACQRCQTIVFTDAWKDWMEGVDDSLLRLVPSIENLNPHTWWEFSPAMITQILGIYGFKTQKLLRSQMLNQGLADAPLQLYTLVATKS